MLFKKIISYINFIIAYLIFHVSYLIAKPTIDSVEGFIPRNVAEGEFYLHITVKGVDPNYLNNLNNVNYGITEANSDKNYYQYLSIYLKEESTTHKLPWSELGEVNTYVRFEALNNEKEDILEQEDGTIDISYNIIIRETDKGALSTLVSQHNGVLTVSVYFLEKDTQNEAKKEDVQISRDISVANEAPTGVTVVGAYKQIIVSWDIKDTITYFPPSSKAPRGMSVIVVDKSFGNITIPAKVFDSTKTEDTQESSCVFNSNFVDNNVCISCPVGVYVDLSKLDSVTGVFYKSTQNSYTIIGGLELGKEYAVFLQYQPDGLQRSVCRLAIPQLNVSMSEYYGEDAAKEKDPRCFIATATYGSAFNYNVKILRQFRDKVLLKFNIGKAFVNLYYLYSPFIAKHIEQNKILKFIFIIILQPIVWITYLVLFVINYFWLVLLGLLSIFIIIYVIMPVRHYKHN